MSATILLADDSLTIQKVVELTFADTDNEVVTVSSGDELLGRLDDVAPDLVICDVIMPGTDGYEVCQSIKSRPATLHIPVVLLTGTFEPFDRDRALAAGADEIITKPFEARRLVEAVEKLLARAGAPAAAEAGSEAPMSFEGEIQPPVLQESDGLDFTTTGFAEMEAAGEAQVAQSQNPGEAPSEGLEMSFSGMPGAQAPAAGDDSLETGGDQEQSTPEEPLEAEEPAEPGPFAASHEPWEGGDEPAPVPAEEDASEPAAPWAADEEAGPAAMADEPEELAEPDDTGEAAWAAEPAGGDEGGPFDHEEPADEPEEGVGELQEVAEEPEPVPELATAPLPAPEAGPEPAEPAATPEAAAAPAPAATQETALPPMGELSDADVERIARRVLELASGTLERIAWEVVPDMAELVVRERVRQLEAEIQREQGETPQ